jgi:hypothetical protein
MFEPNTVGGAPRVRRSLDPPAAFRLPRPEPPARMFGFLSSMTGGVRELAYLVVDVVRGRYDR